MQGVLAIDCGATQIDALSAPKFKDLIFVYACSWNSNGLPWIREIISQEGRYISCLAGEPGRWIVSNHVARTVMDFEFERQNTEQYAKWDWPDFVELCQAIHRTKHIPGDFVEVGCFEGSSSSVALHFMKESRIGRNCGMLDVFDGFNYATADLSPDAVWKGGHVVAGGREIVEQRLKRYEAADIGLNVNVVRSDITKDELPAAIKKIALASIDVDMYEAVLAALRKVRPLLSIGGIVLVDDPPHTPGLIGACCGRVHGIADGAGAIPVRPSVLPDSAAQHGLRDGTESPLRRGEPLMKRYHE